MEFTRSDFRSTISAQKLEGYGMNDKDNLQTNLQTSELGILCASPLDDAEEDCDRRNCDRHEDVVTAARNNSDLVKLVSSYANMYSITHDQRSRAYAVLDEIIQKKLYKNAYIAVRVLFSMNEYAAKRLYDAYRQYKYRQRELENEQDDEHSTSGAGNAGDKKNISVESICTLIARIRSAEELKKIYRFTQDHLDSCLGVTKKAHEK
ncbi:MAG: hypothetical protein ABSA46_11010 [Thermodesulfovibrionales bacterium]|jgi:hypothetical protein